MERIVGNIYSIFSGKYFSTSFSSYQKEDCTFTIVGDTLRHHRIKKEDMSKDLNSFYSDLDNELITEGKFQYVEKGEGEPFILLHGLFGALSNFKAVTDFLSQTHKVLIPKLPIYDLPLLKTNVKNLADFLNAFIDHKGLDQVSLLGNSLGGHVALVYTNMHQHKVKAMILSGSSGLYENAFGGSFPRREDKEFLRNKIALTFYDPNMVTDELVDECYEAVNNRNKVIRILSIAKSAIRHNMRPVIPDYKMPFCLIWGKNDTITPPDVANELQATLQDSSLYWIDKCGHAPMMEHPEEFNQHLGDWMTKKGML